TIQRSSFTVCFATPPARESFRSSLAQAGPPSSRRARFQPVGLPRPEDRRGREEVASRSVPQSPRDNISLNLGRSRVECGFLPRRTVRFKFEFGHEARAAVPRGPSTLLTPR